jgi:hypothetical protein
MSKPSVEPRVASRVFAEFDSRQTEITSTVAVLMDFRSEWNGGSGGTLMRAQIKNGWLEVNTTCVSPGSQTTEFREETINMYDLSAFHQETVEDSVGTVSFRAAPK